MVLDRHRSFLDPVLNPWTHVLRNVHPNILTWVSVPFAILAGWLFFISDPNAFPDRYLILLAAFCVMLNGMLDLLDGRVARATGKQTPWGDFLDHTMDRVSDVIILSGLALSPWVDARVALFGLSVTLLSSYLGTQAQAVGMGRIYSGLLARADRTVLLMGLPIIDVWLAETGQTLTFLPWLPGTQYTLGLFAYYISIGGLFTFLERFVRSAKYLRAQSRQPPKQA